MTRGRIISYTTSQINRPWRDKADVGHITFPTLNVFGNCAGAGFSDGLPNISVTLSVHKNPVLRSPLRYECMM